MKEILKQPARLSPRHRRSESKEVQQLLWQGAKLFISDDEVLFRKNKEQHQVVILHALKEAVYRELHINMAHLGPDRTLQLIKESFYWPKMEEEVRHFINHQRPCVRQRKPHIQRKAPLLPITSSAISEIVGIDFLHLENSSRGFEHILLITDHFTRYIQAYPTSKKLLELLLLISTTILFFTLVFHFNYCIIKENLRMFF